MQCKSLVISEVYTHTSLNLRWLSCTKKRKTEPRESEQVGEAVEAVEDALGGGKVQPSFEGEAGVQRRDRERVSINVFYCWWQ